MNKLFILFFSIILSGCWVTPQWRQDLPPEEKDIVYIDEHSKSKEDAYIAVNEWLAKNFNSGRDVIQMQDKEAGTIVVKALYSYVQDFGAMGLPINVNYVLSVHIKENKIKVEFTTGRAERVNPPGYIEGYLPKNEMPQLLAYYERIHKGLLDALSKQRNTF